jgi:hypothetical protein
MKAWIRDHGLLVALLTLFLASWIGQLVSQWFEFVNEQAQHGQAAAFWSSEFWWMFGQATFENWQSEWLQLSAQILLPAYLIYKGATTSKDSTERMEALVTAIAHKVGVEPDEVYEELPEKYRPSAKERAEMERIKKRAG